MLANLGVKCDIGSGLFAAALAAGAAGLEANLFGPDWERLRDHDGQLDTTADSESESTGIIIILNDWLGPV